MIAELFSLLEQLEITESCDEDRQQSSQRKKAKVVAERFTDIKCTHHCLLVVPGTVRKQTFVKQKSFCLCCTDFANVSSPLFFCHLCFTRGCFFSNSL